MQTTVRFEQGFPRPLNRGEYVLRVCCAVTLVDWGELVFSLVLQGGATGLHTVIVEEVREGWDGRVLTRKEHREVWDSLPSGLIEREALAALRTVGT